MSVQCLFILPLVIDRLTNMRPCTGNNSKNTYYTILYYFRPRDTIWGIFLRKALLKRIYRLFGYLVHFYSRGKW